MNKINIIVIGNRESLYYLIIFDVVLLSWLRNKDVCECRVSYNVLRRNKIVRPSDEIQPAAM